MSTPTILMAGNLTADPELRQTQAGKNYAKLTIVATDRRLNQQTKQREDGDKWFLNCTAWEALADNVAASLSKGMAVIAEVRVHQRTYQANDGTNRTVVEGTVLNIGPSLRFQRAQVQKASNGFQQQQGGFNTTQQGGGFGQFGAYQQQSQAPASDPWNNAQATPETDPWAGGGQANQSGEPEF